MADDNKKSASDTLGITFNEIHSDEPHEAIDAKKAELYSRPLATLASPLKKQGAEMFDVERAYEGSHVEQGTIVSDRKRERASFGENLKSAFSEWWGSAKKNVAFVVEEAPAIVSKIDPAKKKESMIISKAEARKDVIAEAAKHATIAPKDDHKIVIEKFRTLKQDTARLQGVPIVIKEPTIKASPQEVVWTQAAVAPEKSPEPKAVAPSVSIPKISKIATPDLRQSAVAPIIEQRIKKDIDDFAPLTPKQPIVPAAVEKAPPKLNTIQTAGMAPKNEVALADGALRVAPLVDARKRRLASPDSLTWTHTSDTEEVVRPSTQTLPPPVKPGRETPKEKISMRPSGAPLFPRDSRTTIEPLTASAPTSWEAAPAAQEVERYTEPEPELVSALNPAPPAPEEFFTPTVSVEEPVEPYQDVQEIADTASATTPEIPDTSSEEPEFRSTIETPAVAEPSIQIEPPVVRPTVFAQRVRGTSASFSTFIRFAILTLIALTGITLAVVASIYFNVFEKEEAGVGVVTGLFVTQSQVGIPLTGNPESFRTALADAVRTAPSGLTQLYPSVQVGDSGGTRSATSKEFFEFLNTNLPQGTVRVLEDTFMMGSITTTENEPFLVIRSYNFDMLFAGFLAWESTLQRDLAPIFGTPTSEHAIFTDAVQNNKSIRILKDKAGAEMLLYSFINQNTVVVTTSAEALAKIIEQF